MTDALLGIARADTVYTADFNGQTATMEMPAFSPPAPSREPVPYVPSATASIHAAAVSALQADWHEERINQGTKIQFNITGEPVDRRGFPSVEALVADALWVYQLDHALPDSEADDPINEAVDDDIFAVYYGD